MLIDTIRQDMVAAMKAKDADKLRTTRSVIAAVQEAAVSGTESRELSDADVEKVIAAQAKRRLEAAEAYDEGDRPEQAAQERTELAILESYLPQKLSDEELTSLVEAELAAGGWTSKADMGKAMKAVNIKVAGRADGRAIADMVKAKLS